MLEMGKTYADRREYFREYYRNNKEHILEQQEEKEGIENGTNNY